MLTNKKNSPRYNNPAVYALLGQLQEHRQTQQINSKNKLISQRKMHHSIRKQIQMRPLFNNKTKEGQLLDLKNKLIPYIFIPKYKNETFIMPDRVFQRGRAGKRFFIKMKDTSICSFRDQQKLQLKEVLHKSEKQKTIISRKIQEFNRIVDVDDGRKKAAHNTWYLKTRKQFNYARTGSELFSQCQPMMETKDNENIIVRKTSLAKTFDFSNKWRPNSRQSNMLSTTGPRNVFRHHQQKISSVL